MAWDILEFLILSRTSISLPTHTYYRGVSHLKTGHMRISNCCLHTAHVPRKPHGTNWRTDWRTDRQRRLYTASPPAAEIVFAKHIGITKCRVWYMTGYENRSFLRFRVFRVFRTFQVFVNHIVKLIVSNEKSETSETSENSEIIKIRRVAWAGGILYAASYTFFPRIPRILHSFRGQTD